MAECGSAAARVTVVVTTSPIPSHPSPALLRALFASIHAHLPCLDDCPRVLVCDGYRRSEGGAKPQLCPEEAYEAHLAELQRLVGAGDFGPGCRLLRLDSCHGYGRALGRALEAVETEFVLVLQHDWLFVRDFDVQAVVAVMDAHPDVKYVGAQSLTTLGYASRIRARYGLELPPPLEAGGLELVPQLFWYDKPHVCRAEHYRGVVLRDAPTRVGECPERRYGLEHMWPRLQRAAAEGRLAEEHRRFGTYVLDVGAEVTYHLSGRKLKADGTAAAAAAAGAACQALLTGEARATPTFTFAAAERAAVVPGLALIGAARDAPGGAAANTGRFRGRCFLCGAKGHSKLLCPARESSELVGDARGAGCVAERASVVAGC